MIIYYIILDCMCY